MELNTILLLVSAALLVMLAMRVPVAFSLLLSGALGLVLLRDAEFALQSIGRQLYSTPASYVLLVIPLFIAMGIFAKHGRLAEDGFAIARRLLRRLPGGLAMGTVLTCAGFGAVSGSSVATVATIGPVAIREMRRYGYSTAMAAGVVGASGTLGVLIPPSVVLVLYGIVSGESIGQLLIAGIIPGMLSALLYLGAIYVRARRHPELVGAVAAATAEREGDEPTVELQPRPASNPLVPSPLSSAASSTAVAGSGGATEELRFSQTVFTVARVATLFLVVMGGIYLGIVTVTEAAALGATTAMIFFIYDAIRARAGLWTTFKSAILESVGLTSMTFALLVGAAVFTLFLVSARVPVMVTNWVVDLPVSPGLIVVIILLAFIPLGMFLDPVSMLLIGIPLAYPVVTSLGFDGIWFGILVVKLIEMGLVTPPFGMNAYVVAGAAEDVTVEEAFRGILWFVPIDMLTVAVLFLFPPLVLWLPELMG